MDDEALSAAEGFAALTDIFSGIEASCAASADATASAQNRSAKALYEANLARFLSIRHIESVPMLRGDDFQWEMAQPCRLLTLMVSECSELNHLFVAAVARYPPNHRWRLVIGFDEYIPGAKLQLHNQRKCMNISSPSALRPQGRHQCSLCQLPLALPPSRRHRRSRQQPSNRRTSLLPFARRYRRNRQPLPRTTC